MSDHDGFDRDEERARGTIRSLPRVEADPDFRERLKADFVAGRLGETAPDDARGAFGRRSSGRRVPKPSWRRLILPASIAVIVGIFMLLNAAPAPVVTDVTGDGTVTIEGQKFPTTDINAIAGAIRPGVHIELSAGVELDLVYGTAMAVQVSPGSATIPAGPARWFGRAVECRLEIGEMAILTGPRFRGGHLVVTTGEGAIEITGTLVSVFRDTAVTCVCVHEGTASVGIDAADMEPIPSGKRKVMFADGSPPLVTDIAPPHRDHLIEFEKKYGRIVRPDR